jgi:hypothetical protein
MNLALGRYGISCTALCVVLNPHEEVLGLNIKARIHKGTK